MSKTIEIEYSGIRHSLTEEDALTPTFDGTALKQAILEILPDKAEWELEGATADANDDSVSDYGVRYGDDFMPVFWHDDLNLTEYEPGSEWGDLVLAVMKLMEAAAAENARKLGVEAEPLQYEEPKSEPIPVYEVDFDWKF